MLIVPLLAGGRPIGILNLVWAESNRHYGTEDLETMREVFRPSGRIGGRNRAPLQREPGPPVKLRDEFLSIASHEQDDARK